MIRLTPLLIFLSLANPTVGQTLPGETSNLTTPLPSTAGQTWQDPKDPLHLVGPTSGTTYPGSSPGNILIGDTTGAPKWIAAPTCDDGYELVKRIDGKLICARDFKEPKP